MKQNIYRVKENGFRNLSCVAGGLKGRNLEQGRVFGSVFLLLKVDGNAAAEQVATGGRWLLRSTLL
jgi:hypothetical protein